MADFYYKEGDKLVGPVSRAVLIDHKIAQTLPAETEICHAETEAWTTLADPQFDPLPSEPNNTTAIRALPVAVLIGLFIVLTYVAYTATGFVNPFLHGIYIIIEWIYGLMAVILFRVRQGSQATFWGFIAVFSIIALFGLFIPHIQH